MPARHRTRTAAPASQGGFPYAPLVALILAQVGTTSDNAAMNIAVAQLSSQLGASLGDIQVANTVYALVAGAFMVAGGMLGVIKGWRTTLRIGLVLAAAGEACAALAPDMLAFTWAGRLVMGLGASLVTPAVLGFVPALFRGRQRAVAFGAIAGAAAISTLSPLALGALMDGAGFRMTFGALGLYFVLVLASTALLPALRSAGAPARLDGAGTALAALGLGMFLFGVSRVSAWGVIAPTSGCPFSLFGISPALPLAACGLVLLAILVPVERRIERVHGSALIPRSFVESRPVRAGLVAVALPFFYMGAQGMVITPHLQLVAGFSALQTGVFSLVSALPMFALATFLPKIAPHLSSRLIIRGGFAAMAAACALIALGVTSDGVEPALFVGVGLGGFGVGAVNSQANNAVASAVSGRDAQQSGGMQGAARNIGMALGTAAAGTSLLLTLSFGMAGVLPTDAVDAEARPLLIEQSAAYTSHEGFLSVIEPYGMSAEAADGLASAHAQVQTDATRITFALLGLVMLAGLPGTRRLVETAVPRDRPACAASPVPDAAPEDADAYAKADRAPEDAALQG